MKSFTPEQLARSAPLGISWLMGTVMEAKGRQELFEHQSPERLRTLRQQAIVQSTESSNRIEGVTVERERLLPLVLGKTKPRDRSEEEIVGYRQALSHIHEHHAHYAINEKEIKHLHSLAQGGYSADAGEYKQRDNDIIQIFPDGRREIRFSTVEATQTPEAMKQLYAAYHHTLQQGLLPPLLLIANTIFDFLCIHPFRDGNGRVSRLFTLLLLYQHGYRVGRYISLERIIEETKESYYEALHASSADWHQGKHDLVPWWSYWLSTMRLAYKELEGRVEQLSTKRGHKTEIIKQAILSMPTTFRISELHQKCPEVSREMLKNVLSEERSLGRLEVIGKGAGSQWKKLGSLLPR